ncbi:MAG: hypothetical protein KC589_09640, partial [Nanoarchaeota archaeon]|nr:hypothetical protein [Nanoarchaeota archaeon]
RIEMMLYSVLFSFSFVFLALIILISEKFSEIIGIESFKIRILVFVILIISGIFLLNFSLYLKRNNLPREKDD